MTFAISDRPIGPGHPCYCIAEISGNHNGSLQLAKELIEWAKLSQADAVKLQCYTPDTITIDHDGPEFILKDGLWKGRKLYDLYKEAHTPWEWFPELFAHAEQVGITCFSSVFDPSSVDFLESLHCPSYKIASFEITDIPLIRYAAKTGKPIIISTGAGSTVDVKRASQAANHQAAMLHCVSEYPASDPLLYRIKALKKWFPIVGFSDHTVGITAPILAVKEGACIVEKHLTLARSEGGPDAAFSLEPHEFKAMVEAVKRPRAKPGKKPLNGALRRSLYVVADIAAGEALTHQNVRSIRPGHGMHPSDLPSVLGKRAAVTLSRGTPLKWSHIR